MGAQWPRAGLASCDGNGSSVCRLMCVLWSRHRWFPGLPAWDRVGNSDPIGVCVRQMVGRSPCEFSGRKEGLSLASFKLGLTPAVVVSMHMSHLP